MSYSYSIHAVLGLVAVLIPRLVGACPICMPQPSVTVADQLIEADVVAFGRESSAQPFSFTVVEVLKGKLPNPHVDLFADSATRLRLNADASRAVILLRSGQKWENLGVADKQYQQVVRRILVFSPTWQHADGDERRLQYFLSLWGHENRAVFELAYLEVGRAPYSWIKKFGDSVSLDELGPLLTRREYLQWRSLAILLLAQREDERTRGLITESFENCARFSLTTNLAAWATAYLEIHGAGGIEVIEERYLRDPQRSPEEIRAIVSALSIHGQAGAAGLREQVVNAYGSALRVHPVAAGQVVRDLTVWKEWRYCRRVATLVAHQDLPFEGPELAELKIYSARAHELD